MDFTRESFSSLYFRLSYVEFASRPLVIGLSNTRGERYWSVFLGALTLGFLAIALFLLALRFISHAKAKAFA
jgi:hypothetical protein